MRLGHSVFHQGVQDWSVLKLKYFFVKTSFFFHVIVRKKDYCPSNLFSSKKESWLTAQWCLVLHDMASSRLKTDPPSVLRSSKDRALTSASLILDLEAWLRNPNTCTSYRSLINDQLKPTASGKDREINDSCAHCFRIPDRPATLDLPNALILRHLKTSWHNY